jgi:hypothetical protein
MNIGKAKIGKRYEVFERPRVEPPVIEKPPPEPVIKVQDSITTFNSDPKTSQAISSINININKSHHRKSRMMMNKDIQLPLSQTGHYYTTSSEVNQS